MDLNLYKILGLSKSASLDEIRAAYRRLARRYHPDKNVELGETELFLDVQNAFDILSDPVKRAEYDNNLTGDHDDEPSISVATTYSRSTLTRIEEPQLMYVLLELLPQIHISREISAPINLCLVLDVSTSMQGRYLDMLKLTAIKLIREMRKQDILSIVTFSDRANILVPAGMIREQKSIETQIQLLKTSGGTEIYQGLQRGYAEVSRYRSEKHINHILLITDGRTYGDEEDCIQLAQKAADQCIGISGLGIGHKWNDELLDELSAKSGGSSIYVSKPTEILHFLLDKFINLNERVAQNVNFELELEQGVELQYAYRLQPEPAPLHLESPLVFGSIQESTSLKVLFELLVHDLRSVIGDKVLLKGIVSLDVPTKTLPHETYKLTFNRPTSLEFSTEIPPTRIVEALSKVTLYRMQEQARMEIADGVTTGASKRLHHLATQLIARGENDLAKVVEEEAENLKQTDGITEQGKKRIKYGTRNLLLPKLVGEQ